MTNDRSGRYKISMVRMSLMTDELANVRVYTKTMIEKHSLIQSELNTEK